MQEPICQREEIEKCITELVAPRGCMSVGELLNPVGQYVTIPDEADVAEFLLGGSEGVEGDHDEVPLPSIEEQLH